jgi:hypothetical protein
MTTHNNTQPDVEIYIKSLENDQLLAWLSDAFVIEDESALSYIDMSKARSYTINLTYRGAPLEVSITPCAAGKAYTSIWFKSQHTPWESDLACAESALSHIDTEVRCSAESWAEEEPEFSEKWWRITRSERELVVWG